MSGYRYFSRFYDALTFNVDYAAQAKFFAGLIEEHTRRSVELVLDLCCGTGSLSRELSGMGWEMICVDASPEMLSIAASKEYEKQPLFLCQKAEELDLYGTIDACICALDSLNHLSGTSALEAAIQKVSLFLAPGGVFVFDLNTEYKHRKVLDGNAYVYETQEVYCVWRNNCRADGSVEITLDFFSAEADGSYTRYSEFFTEQLFSHQQVLEILGKTELEYLAVMGEGCHRRSKMTLNRRRELTHENREVTLKTKRLGGARYAKEWDNYEDKRVGWGG
ncbi:MAG: class I SAM-dependent DNA methyltransferase [Oscillospiraceae bacterium]